MYSLDEAAQVLGFHDPRKLRRCLQFIRLTPDRMQGDHRQKLISPADMIRLQTARDTLWPPIKVLTLPGAVPPMPAPTSLDMRLIALERRVATLEALVRASRAPTPAPAEPPISADASEPTPDGVPLGSERLHTFARNALGMSPTTLRDWVRERGIECVNVRNPTRPGEQERWLTPTGQQQARDRLARKG